MARLTSLLTVVVMCAAVAAITLNYFLLQSYFVSDEQHSTAAVSSNSVRVHNEGGHIAPWYYADVSNAALSKVGTKSPPNQPGDIMTDAKLKEDTKKARNEHGVNYGGADVDPPHLGGFTDNDTDTYEPHMWNWFIKEFGITSVLDIGCGKGYASTWFQSHESVSRVLCVEGSTEAIKDSLVPSIAIQHDYSKGAWWPKEEYDMVWSAEFLEHVDEEFIPNYLSTMKRAKWILVTHSVWGGWHHSTVHNGHWWIEKFSQYGFEFRGVLTEQARKQCPMSKEEILKTNGIYYLKSKNKDGESVIGRGMSHFRYHGLVFANSLYFNKRTPFDKALSAVTSI